jgi:NAD(P)-dependent dehydrogenase (short-subunit alcohol dehydrogenase family)
MITGAGRGIGRATAVELASRGYELVLVSRTEAELAQTAQLIGRGLIIPADIADPASAQRIVEQTQRAFGRIDVLVNNAGLAPLLTVEQTTPDQWRRILDVNLSAAFYLSRAVWPVYVKQKGGVIVNVSSVASKDPFPGFVAYAAAKAGLNMLSITMAKEGQPHGIRVHTVAPGAVETGMFRALMSPEQWPTEKALDPAEVARIIGHCVAGDLRYTSGEVIFVARPG